MKIKFNHKIILQVSISSWGLKYWIIIKFHIKSSDIGNWIAPHNLSEVNTVSGELSYSSFSIIRYFLQYPGRILPALTEKSKINNCPQWGLNPWPLDHHSNAIDFQTVLPYLITLARTSVTLVGECFVENQIWNSIDLQMIHVDLKSVYDSFLSSKRWVNEFTSQRKNFRVVIVLCHCF